MLHFIRRPLPPGSAFGGERLPVRALLPNPAAVTTFLSISGPVLGVVVMKVLLFGMIAARAAEAGAVVSAGHQIIFSARPSHFLPPGTVVLLTLLATRRRPILSMPDVCSVT